MKLEVFRADPPRACVLVVVLCDDSRGGCFRARISHHRYDERGSSDHRAQRYGARPVYDNVEPVRALAEDVDRTRFEATMGKNLRGVRRDLAAAQLIECIHKVE